MSDTEKCLFIGGTRDGEWLSVPPSYNHVVFPVFKKADAMSIKYEYVRYRRELFRANDLILTVWVEDTLTIQQVLQKIFDNYHPAPK